MLFKIERYAIRAGSGFLRRCFSKNLDIQVNSENELQLYSNIKPSEQKQTEKSLKIVLLGAPNAGKSTLVNQLIKRSVCAVSSKVHTTQTKADAIYSEGDTQLIFMDTPGMVSTKEFKRYKLATNFQTDPKVSLNAADIVGIVQDAQNVFTRDKINPNILELLTQINKEIPTLLIFNKVDLLKKKHILLHLVNVLTKSKISLEFSDVFMVSALTGDGVDDLRTYFLDSAKSQHWHYEKHIYSDRTCEEIIQQTVRAKLLDNLPQEVPYGLQLKLEHFDIGPDDSISAIISITCPKARNVGLLLQRKGQRIKTIAVTAEQELRHAFRTPVTLKLICTTN